jgi:hypothetical protein
LIRLFQLALPSLRSIAVAEKDEDVDLLINDRSSHD